MIIKTVSPRPAYSSALAVFGLGLASMSDAQAASLVGAGSGLTGATMVDGGGRTNVDRNFRYLPAGTYNVLDFNFNGVAASGTVQPFLSTSAGSTPATQQHTPVWSGSAGAAALGTNTVNYTPGSQQFTLSAPTRIYSGFSMTAASVGHVLNVGATDHNGTPLTPVTGTQFGTFSNNNIPRTYAAGLNVLSANPVTGGKVGAGSGITGSLTQDTINTNTDRMNVDLLFVTLSPGTYQVSNWELNVFANDQPGTVTPMLLTRGPSSYETLWLGSAFDPATNGAQTLSATGTFTLGATTEVFAGFFTQGGGAAIVALDQNTALSGNLSLTDHDSAFAPPTGTGQSLTLTGATGFSNPNLARTYAFGINTVAVPEPASLGLLALSGLATLTRRRKLSA